MTDLATLQAERLARAQSRSVMILTPMARHPTRQFMTAMIKTIVLLKDVGISCYVQTVQGNSNLPRARNELVAHLLASHYTDGLFIDDDMNWSPGDVLRLLASDKPVIGGVGPKKVLLEDTNAQKWCCRVPPGDEFRQDDMGAIEVEAVGTGFLKISRDVFEAMARAHPDWKRDGWPNMPADLKAQYFRFFRFDNETPQEFSEDFLFCHEWRALGGTVWVDPTIRLGHVGEYEFTGDFTAILERAQ